MVLGLRVCVCVCVCLLLNISLFTCLFVPQTILTFSTASEARNFKRFSLKMLRCEARVFPVGTAYGYMISRPFFTPRKTRMRMNLDHITSGRFVLGRDVHCEFDYWPLAVSMPPTKVCPQCEAAVPVRWKTCERCDHVVWFPDPSCMGGTREGRERFGE